MDREKVIKALSICVPETQDDSRLECSDCPYGDVCNPNDIVGITLPLIWDIRALLKEQEAVEPIEVDGDDDIYWQPGDHDYVCGSCHEQLAGSWWRYCPYCGHEVKWE